mgnify:CR=1 FL=1
MSSDDRRSIVGAVGPPPAWQVCAHASCSRYQRAKWCAEHRPDTGTGFGGLTL